MRLLYTISIYSYYLAIRIASLFIPKAKIFLKGRKNIFDKIGSAIQKTGFDNLIWFHCASLGEFEQGRPLIEKIKRDDPQIKILLTFFSPSGYEVRKNYPGADLIFYLPIDTPSNARKFMEIVKPQKVFFVKYEFWFNYLKELKNNNIPTYLVSGIFREDHYFFRFSGAWFRKQLSSFTHFFLQDKKSVELLNSICFNNATLCGDTRFDRVLEISKNAKQIELVKQFVSDKKIMILGSSWAEDEKIVASCFLKNQQLKTNYKIIIAPHEIDENHISSIEALFISEFSCLRYSNASDLNIKDAQLLIVDNVGMLSSLYQYGTIAFIGGGFGKGIHNILEAATFGLPVIFGPNYQKFTEAKELIKLGGAFSVNDILEFEKTLILLSDEQVLKTASVISKMYVQGRVGATEKILDAVFPK